MRRVVVTGMGVVSCLGNDKGSVSDALRQGRSGIRFNEAFAEMGLRSHVCGSVDIDLEERIERKARRFMGDAAAYAYVAMQDAIADAGLDDAQVSNERTGLIARKLSMLIADGSMAVDGRTIYTAEDLKVGLFLSTDSF